MSLVTSQSSYCWSQPTGHSDPAGFLSPFHLFNSRITSFTVKDTRGHYVKHLTWARVYNTQCFPTCPQCQTSDCRMQSGWSGNLLLASSWWLFPTTFLSPCAWTSRSIHPGFVPRLSWESRWSWLAFSSLGFPCLSWRSACLFTFSIRNMPQSPWPFKNYTEQAQ